MQKRIFSRLVDRARNTAKQQIHWEQALAHTLKPEEQRLIQAYDAWLQKLYDRGPGVFASYLDTPARREEFLAQYQGSLASIGILRQRVLDLLDPNVQNRNALIESLLQKTRSTHGCEALSEALQAFQDGSLSPPELRSEAEKVLEAMEAFPPPRETPQSPESKAPHPPGNSPELSS